MSIHLHRWSQWGSASAEYEASPLGKRIGLPATWLEYVQVRRCEKCGLTKMRRINIA